MNENNEEINVFPGYSEDIHGWAEELIANKKLLVSIVQVTRGPIIELRFIFREGKRSKKKVYKYLEQCI